MDKNPHEKDRQGRYFFTEQELEQLKDTQSPMNVGIGKLEREIEDLKREIKSRDAKVKGLRQQLLETAQKIEDRYEMRPIKCIRFKSYKTKEWIFVGIETQDIVTREDFEKGDEQRGIVENIWPPDNGESLSSWMVNYVIEQETARLENQFPILTGKRSKKQPDQF